MDTHPREACRAAGRRKAPGAARIAAVLSLLLAAAVWTTSCRLLPPRDLADSRADSGEEKPRSETETGEAEATVPAADSAGADDDRPAAGLPDESPQGGSASSDPRAAEGDSAPADGLADERADGGTPGKILAAGLQSAVRVPVARVISDQLSWQQAWAVIHANQLDPPPVPSVDFSESRVVVLILGERDTGGYSVAVAAVRELRNAVEVEVAVTAPEPGMIVSQALTSPYSLVAIPRSSKPVVFVGDDVTEGFHGD